jgi:phosphoglycolate phosphatase
LNTIRKTHCLKGSRGNVSRFANVLVDLDGTVTDPFEGVADCVEYAMKCMGHTPPFEDVLRGYIGRPLRQTFGGLLATHDASRIEEAMCFYRERFSVLGLFENRVYPGLPELLADLKTAGCRLFLATAKPCFYAQQIIHHFELTKYFVRVYGSDLYGGLENKGDLVRFLLHSERMEAGDTAMVGDRAQDMLAAKAHSVCAVGVTWGYGSQEELEDAGADVTCNSPGEVLRFITETAKPAPVGLAGSAGLK